MGHLRTDELIYIGFLKTDSGLLRPGPEEKSAKVVQ